MKVQNAQVRRKARWRAATSSLPAATQKQVRRVCNQAIRSVCSLSYRWRKNKSQEVTWIGTHADLGTGSPCENALTHAETGTLRQLSGWGSPKNRRIPRRNGYALAKADRIVRLSPFFLWITLWTTWCCPRRFRYAQRAEAGTVSRRSGYAIAQNLVRPFAESGSVYPSEPSADKALRAAYTVYL